MRVINMAAALLLLAATARADVSDSGDLSIGGNAVIGGSVTAGAFFGDGSHLSGVNSLPVGSIVAYATSTAPSGWLECDGAAYSTTAYATLYSSIGCTWGCSGSNFNVPDLRGVFLRGWNHNASTSTYIGDQDAVSRSTISVGGRDGDNVGSYQNDAFRSHFHTGVADVSPSVTGPEGAGTNLATSGQTDAAGGNETRPKNAYVLFLIKSSDGASGGGAGSTFNGGVITNQLIIAGASQTITGAGGLLVSGAGVSASSGVFLNGITVGDGAVKSTFAASGGLTLAASSLLALGAGSTFYASPTAVATGWVGTSGGTITVGQFPLSNLAELLVVSTQIPCATGVASMTFVVNLDTAVWNLSLDLYGVTTTTGVISISFDDLGDGRYSWRAQNISNNGPYINTSDNGCSLMPNNSTRFQMQQDGYFNVDVRMTNSLAVDDPDYYMLSWVGNVLQSSLGSGEVDQIRGACAFNNLGNSAPRKFTIQINKTTLGQQRYCGSIALTRRPR
ncbi:MAG: phage tail protein [Elusimicrobiota bacterium]|nr:phage tail protein [Elusimicrobiota bacterium]